VHAGFGPFLSIYLLSQAWTQADVGFVLAGAGLVGLVGQVPGGALVDRVRAERTAAAASVALIGASSLALVSWPAFPVVLVVCLLYAAANCVLIPAITAISLGLVGHEALGERLARNARFTSLGSGLATAGMGLIGYAASSRAVFLCAAGLTLPVLIAISRIRADEIDPDRAHGSAARMAPASRALAALLTRPFLVLIAGTVLFHFGNAPGLVLFSKVAAMAFGPAATIAIAGAIIVSQAAVALVSPRIGRRATDRGRRTLLLLSYAILTVRLVAASAVGDPAVYIVLQLLDGVCAAIFATVVPLVAADLTQGTGHFNLAIGVVGTALSVGASAGIAASGAVADRLGNSAAFLLLAASAALALLLTWRAMPETRPVAATTNEC
jgi:predicted MFS family arabinose efflux permease